MNVAFSAILALVLLIPGLIFVRVRRGFGEFARIIPPPPQPFSTEIAAAFVWASAIHAVVGGVAYILHAIWQTPRPNPQALMMLLVGKFGEGDMYLNWAISSIADHPYAVLVYMLCSCATAALAASVFAEPIEKVCRYFNLVDGRDATVSEWNLFATRKNEQDVLLTAVVEMGGIAWLFLGVLQKLHFNPHTGELDRIELRNVAKRRLAKDHKLSENAEVEGVVAEEPESETGEFEEVFGHQFILRMSEIKTLNAVHFSEIQDSEPPTDQPAPP